MNKFIKFACLLILTSAPAYAMDHKRNYADEVWPNADCLTKQELAVLKKARAEETKENFGELLITAARDGNVQAITELLWRGAPANYQSSQGSNTALMYAAANGHFACAEKLLAAGANAHLKNNGGKVALDYASRDSHYELEGLIQAHLNSARDPQAFIQAFLTAKLVDAAKEGKLALVKSLISKGVQVFENNALIYAAKSGHIDCVKELIAANAQVDYTDSQNYTALIWAAAKDHCPCVEALLHAKADVFHRNDSHRTALNVAKKIDVTAPKISLKKKSRQALARQINKRRAHRKIKWGPIMNSFFKLICVSILATTPAHTMDHRANFGEPNSHAQEPAKTKKKRDYADEVWPKVNCLAQEELAVLKKARAEETKENFGELLITAARDGKAEAVKELLWRGASANYQSSQDLSTALIYAKANGHFACTQTLIAAKADINQKNNIGRPADASLTPQLIEAAQQNNLILLTQLLHKGAQASGNEALIEAAKLGNLPCVKQLINSKAQVDHTNSEGNTALMYAALNGHYVSAQMLIDAKADINLKNNQGQVALDYASRNNHRDLKTLIQAAVDAAASSSKE